MPKFHESLVSLHYAAGYVNPVRSLSIFRSIGKTKRNSLVSKIFVIFAADTEYTPPWKSGSWVREGSDPATSKGTENIESLLSANSIKSTFLLEGILARNDPKLVQSLSDAGHEIGYHGYAHESYGGTWKTNTVEQPRILGKEEVSDKLVEGKEILRNINGQNPRSFVAPFHHTRKSTMEFLAEEEYSVDSSVYNHLYGIREPFKIYYPNGRRVLEIPFSVPLKPRWRFGISPFFPTILEAAVEDFDGTVADIQFPPKSGSEALCLLLTCHPWEFIDDNDAKFRTLRKLFDYLISTRKTTFCSMQDFQGHFEKEFNNQLKYEI